MPTAQQADPKVVEEKEIIYSLCTNEDLLVSLEALYLRRTGEYKREFFDISEELHSRIDEGDRI